MVRRRQTLEPLNAKLLAMLGTVGLAACSFSPDVPQSPVVQSPKAQAEFVTAEVAPVNASTPDARWWRLYDNAELDGYVARALEQNNDLKAALANLEIWESEPVLERIAALARMQEQRLQRFLDDPRFENPRRGGTIAAVDIRVEGGGYLAEIGPRLYQFLLGRDQLLRPLGNTIYLMPPYCASADDLDAAYDAIAAAPEALS